LGKKSLKYDRKIHWENSRNQGKNSREKSREKNPGDYDFA